MHNDADSRIYLDNGATSWPKPPGVVDAIVRFYSQSGAAASRGGSNAVAESNRVLEQCRRYLAQLVNAATADQVVLAFNGTDALNMAIHGMLRPQGHAVATAVEHNSVLRPLAYLQKEREIKRTIVPCDASGWVDPELIRHAIRPETQLVCLSQVSNVTGTIQSVAEVGRFCRDLGVPLLVDAAQSVGHLDVDVNRLECDLLAASGHKALMGPLGTGFLYIGERVQQSIRPWRLGGTGSQSDEDTQPQGLPWKMESGNMNIGGLAGLLGGLKFIQSESVSRIHRRAMQLTTRLRDGLNSIKTVKCYVPTDERSSAVTSFNIERRDCREVGAILDSVFGIELRAGYHCAPRIHQFLGSEPNYGTLRVTPGYFNTEDQIDQLIDAVRQIAGTNESGKT